MPTRRINLCVQILCEPPRRKFAIRTDIGVDWVNVHGRREREAEAIASGTDKNHIGDGV